MAGGDPDKAIIIQKHAFAQAMGLVDGSGQHRIAKPSGICLSPIGIHMITAQLHANAAWVITSEGAVEFIAPVGSGNVEHKVGTMKLHGRKDVGAKEGGCAQYFCCEVNRAIYIADDQVEAKALQ